MMDSEKKEIPKEEEKKEISEKKKEELDSIEEENESVSDKQKIKERKEKLMTFFKTKNSIVYVFLTLLIWFSAYIRTRNLSLLNGKYPLALDPYLFLRYTEYIVEHGKLFAIDFMRNFPVGFNTAIEVPLLPYLLAYQYKILNFFTSISVAQSNIIYPVIAFSIALVFFFFFVRKLFNNNLIAGLSSLLLAIAPAFLYRTMAGFADKEAMGIMFMFMTLYFYISAIKSKKYKKNLIFGLLAAGSTIMMGLVWGGVSFIFMSLGLFAFIQIIINRFSMNDFVSYLSWCLPVILLLPIISHRFTIISFTISGTSGIMVLALAMAILHYFLVKKNLFGIVKKFEGKIPESFVILGIGAIFLILAGSLFATPDFLLSKPQSVINDMINPLQDRWALTVAESHEPYIKDWIKQSSWLFVLSFIAGSALLVFEALKNSKKKWKLVTFYLVLIIGFIFSRYAEDVPLLNGTSGFALLLYVGSLLTLFLGFLAYYVYAYRKDKDELAIFSKIPKETIFVIIFFIIMILSARRASRLVMMIIPVGSLLFSYLLIRAIDYQKEKGIFTRLALPVISSILVFNYFIAKSSFAFTLIASLFVGVLLYYLFNIDSIKKKDYYKVATYAVIFFVIASVAYSGALVSIETAKVTAPSFNGQWQRGMGWVQENTPEDAVFGHWWDYGYWVQTGGKRATVTDGGNAIGYWNYFMGRYALTGRTDKEAAEFLYAHNVTHFLMISDELGKYPAYSSIGSNENYDRYSWVQAFVSDDANTQETREGMTLLYTGGQPFDEDFIWDNKILPAQAAGVAAVKLPLKQIEAEVDFPFEFEQPTAIVVYNGQQYEVPIECLFYNGEEIYFDEKGLNGCFVVVPSINGQTMNALGGGFYLTDRTKNSRVGQLYIMGKESEYFKLVYEDSADIPLAIYNGNIIGPLKIWEMNYPSDIVFNETYLDQAFPQSLRNI